MKKASDTRTQASPLIVGVGASAGGLAAFQELLVSIGDTPGMAIVFIQHYESASDSLLADQVRISTSMNIVELAGRKKLKTNTLYLCPPQSQLELRKGLVSISAQGEGGRTGFIDHFFHELAEDQGERGVGVILSGLGSEGTLGLKAISDHGGMTFAQSEDSAKLDSMPRSAATSGVADHVMAPAEIATELLAYARHLDRVAGETSESRLKKRIEDSLHPSDPTVLVAGSLEPDRATDLTALRQRMLLDEFLPGSCVINHSGQVLDVAANLEKYLPIIDGVSPNNILKMAASGLRGGLRTAIEEARRTARRVTHENMSVRVGEMIQRVMITVQPMPQAGEQGPLYMIVFHDVGLPVHREEAALPVHCESRAADDVIAQMECERNWRMAVDVAQMGVLKFDYLKNTVIADARAARLYSVPADTPIPCDEVHARFHPDDRQMIEDLMAASMTPDSDGQFAVEHRVLLHDGTLRWLSVRMQIFFRAINGSRRSTHAVLAVIDVTEKNEAARQLLKAKQRSDLAMATGRLGEWEWDVRSDVVTWGDSLLNLLGYSRDNAPGTLQDVVAAIHPDDHALTKEVIQSALQSSRENYLIENRMLRADGKVVWIEGRGQIHRAEDGQPLSIVGMATDITERKITELKLADREAHLRRVIDGSLGFLVVLGTDGTVLEPNATALASIDITRDEVVGRKFWDCYWWSFDPRVQAQVRNMIAHAAQGQAVRQDLDFRVLHDQRRIGDAVFSPVLDEHGTVSHVVGSGIDITDRAAAEAALLEREQRLSLALEAGQMGTFTSYLDSQKLIWSDSAYVILGVENTGQELTDEDLLNIVHPDDRDELVANQAQSLDGNETDSSFEFRVIRPVDGRTAWVSVRGKIARDTDGQARQIAGVIMDITTRKQAELEIVRRESELRRILDHIVGLVGVLDRQGNLLEANAAALQIGGVARDDVIGKPFWDCYWWNYDAAVSNQLRSSFHRAVKGDLVRYDAEVRTAGEGRATIDLMLAPVKDADGTVTHVIPSAVDVTQRRRMELDLADSRAQLAATMEAAQTGSFQWEPETDLADWDDSWIRIMGITVNTPKVGQTFFDLVHPDDLAALKAGMPHPAHEPQPYQSEFRIIRPDGEVRWFVGNGIMRPARNGQPARLIGLNWDITDTKLAEERIRQGEERLQMAMRAAGLSHWEWDIDNDRITWTNELFQQPAMQPRDLIGGLDDFLALVHDDDRDTVHAQVETAITLGTPYRAEFRIRQPDGTYRWLLAMGHLTRELGGKPTALVGVEMDVTDRHEYENQLKKARRLAEAANESKSEFVANMSHEIRTPMTAVLGYADLLFARENDPEKLEHLRIIKRNGYFLLEIIDDILDLSMIEAGKLAIERVAFSPSNLVADVHSMMQVRAGEKQLQFDVDYDGPVPEVIVSDPRRLKQIFVNLIGNAIKFTEAGGVRITVRFLGSDSQQLQFEVSDSGIGMTEEQRLKLFQPFAQGDASISRRFGGAGLGLAISQRLAGLLGGDISVVSRSGEGSVFTFTIATGANDESTLINPPSNASVELSYDASIQDMNLDCLILVVDDQRDIRVLVRHFLTGAGADVDEAEDGEAAVKYVKTALASQQSIPDLIFLDMQMPRLDGYGTVEELRKIGYQNPVIALTANAMQSDMDRCLVSGCDAYLRKPIDPSALLQMVKQMMNREPPEDQHRQGILIVDDSVDTVRLLKLLLERDGNIVSSALTGKQAIESARKLTPHTIILDLTLPDMTGFEVLASLKAMPHLLGTRFLALTGHTGESDIRRCLEAGFHQHVAKPIDIASLRDLLQHQTERRKRKR